MFDRRHPVWALLRLTIMMVALTAVLYLTASRFDSTELRTIITMFVIGSGLEMLGFFLPRGDG